jgi:GntR family transcriptional regulator
MADQPAFLRIHDDIKKRIENGEFKVGDRLPSERELSIEYGVSRMTLRQAITNLNNEGIVDRRTGAGTYIAEKTIIENMRGITSFSQLMTQMGRVPSTKFISYKLAKPTDIQAAALDLSIDDDIVVIERIRLGDNEPIAYEIATLPAKIVENIRREELYTSLYKALENQGLRLDNASAQQEFNAKNADEQIAKNLGIKTGDAILYLKQITSFSNGKPFEFVTTYYAGDRYHVILERKGI